MQIKTNHGTRSAGRVALAAGLAMGWAFGASGQCAPNELYGAAIVSASGPSPLAVGTGDVDNDGNVDVVTANFGDSSISLMRGNGDGTLQAEERLPFLAPGSIESVGPIQPAVGDLNGDGWADLVIGVQSPDLGAPGAAVFLNDGTGQFPDLPEFYAFSTQLRDMEIVDLTGDGIVDLVYANRDDDTINIVPGNGDGTFQIEDFVNTIGGPVGVVIRDFDGDGNLDIASPLVFDSQIVVYLGDGAGGFTELTRFSADSPEDLAAGDVNGDGEFDLVTAFLNGGETQVFLGNGDGTFGPKISVSTGAGTLPFSVELADADGDGFDDIHSALFLAGSVNVAVSNGDGTFQTGVGYPVSDFLRQLKLDDFDNDGVIDVVASNGRNPGEVGVLLNDCLGGSEPCPADVNGDGEVTPADFNAWIIAFNNQAPECDQNGDGQCDPSDFNAWILNFNNGC